jgi:hypothetical protein
MKVGDLVKIKEGCFMGGKIGLVVSETCDSFGAPRFYIRLTGSVPKAIKNKPIMYREARVIILKSSNDRDNKKS